MTDRGYEGLHRAQREPGLREAVFELTWRYHFWRTACAISWVLFALVVLVTAR